MKFIFNISRYVLVTSALLGFVSLAATAQTPKPKPSKTPASGYHESHGSPSSGQQNSFTSHYKADSKAEANAKKPKGLKSTAASGSADQQNSFTAQSKKKKVKPTTPTGYTNSSSSGASGEQNSMSSQPH
jgi:hypothetical protein